MALATTLFMASCSNDDLTQVTGSDEAKVSFSISLESEAGTKSRAISDGKSVDKLYYAVFDEDGKLWNVKTTTTVEVDNAYGITGLKRAAIAQDGIIQSEGKKQDIIMLLAKGQTYKIVFWAQNDFATDDNPYTFSYTEGQNFDINIDYTKMKTNNDDMDAFFAIVDYTVSNNANADDTETVILKRPFAQLNVGVTTTDWEAAVDAGFTATHSKVRVNNMGTKLDLLTGAVTGDEDYTFDMNAIPADEEKLILKDGSEYKYLSSTYVLINDGSATGDTRSTLNSLEFEFHNTADGTGRKVEFKDGLTNIPVERNWRTNFVGQILTGNIQFEVSIDQNYIGDVTNHKNNVATIDDANKVFLNGDTTSVTITGTNGGTIILPNTKEAVSISFTNNIPQNNNITIGYNNGSLETSPEVVSLAGNEFNSLVTLVVPHSTAYAKGVFNGGITASTASNTLYISSGSKVNNLIVNQGNVVIEEESEVEKIETQSNEPIIVTLAEGVEVPETSGNIVIMTQNNEVSDATQLESALTNALPGAIITLTEDITTDKVFLISKDVIINGNNHKITSSDTRVFRLTTSDINVVMNDLNIVSRTKMVYPNDIRGIAIDANTQNIVLALNNCSVDFTDASACDWAYAVNIAGNTSGHALTINGGTYESANVINIWGQNHTINIDGATLTSLYAPNDLYYGACAMFNENESNVSTGNNMTIKNTTFNGTHAVAIENAGGEDNNVITANNTDNTKYYPVKAGETYYYTLAEAIGAIESEGTVKLLSSIKLEENVSINKNMTLDLNGKTIEGTDNATGSFGLIDMKPGFTLNILNNNINNEVGKITLTAKNNRAWNAYSSVVSNQRATLIVGENVVIEHLGGTDMAYGIDNLTNTGAEHAKTTINGATVKSTYRAIRQFLNSSAEGVNNELYVNSGVIEGSNKSIWMQDANAKANPGKLVVTENAQLKGDVYLFVTAGSTEWPVEVSIAAAALVDDSEVLTGNVPEGYVVVINNGNHVVKKTVTKEASNLDELKTALEAAGQAGAGYTTINITADIDMQGKEWKPISIDGYHGADIVTVEGNNHTITGLTGGLFAGGFAGGSGIVVKNLTIENSTIIANNTQGYGAFVGCADSMDEITLINCHLKSSSIITPNEGKDESRIGGLIGWTAGYNNQNDGPVDSYITVKDCSVTECTLKGAGSIGAIVGHAGANAATFTTIENCTITGNTLHSTDDGDWRVGVVVGTANNGQCVIKNIKESNNTLTQDGKTAPENKSNLYGRFVPSGTGTLTIDGTEIK